MAVLYLSLNISCSSLSLNVRIRAQVQMRFNLISIDYIFIGNYISLLYFNLNCKEFEVNHEKTMIKARGSRTNRDDRIPFPVQDTKRGRNTTAKDGKVLNSTNKKPRGYLLPSRRPPGYPKQSH